MRRKVSGRGHAPRLPPWQSRRWSGGSLPCWCHAWWMASVANINDVLKGHGALEIECVDRLYVNAYVPNPGRRGRCGSCAAISASSWDPLRCSGTIGNLLRREVC
jgi:hypothetical protein